MNKGILIIYNSCTIGRVSHGGWNEDLDAVLSQDLEHYSVAVSECRGQRKDLDNNSDVSNFVDKTLSNGFLYNIIQEQLSLFATFNHTIQEAVKKNGPYEYYMHMTSGITLPNSHFLSDLYRWLKNNKEVGRAVLAIEGTDNFFPPPHGHPYNQRGTPDGAYPPKSLNTEALQIMPGYAAAEHCWVYPHEMYEKYDGRIAPDMYLSNGAGALYSYLTAAIGKKNMIVPWNVVPRLPHKQTQDGPTKIEGANDSWWMKHKTLEEVNAFVSRLDENSVFVDTYCGERKPSWRGRSQQHLSPEHKKILEDKFGEDGIMTNEEDRTNLISFLKKEFYVTEDMIDYENINSVLLG